MKKHIPAMLSLFLAASIILSACGANAPAGKVKIRWYVGLGTGSNPDQLDIQQEVVSDFNTAHPNIELSIEIVPSDIARETLDTQIAANSGPDVIGPVGWGGSNAFYGQWLDMASYIKASGFDTSVFDPALVKFYQTGEGQVGLPFAVFPAGIYYVPAYFDAANLVYPPQKYGEKYTLDGKQVDWNWNTFTEVARRLTIDTNNNNSNSTDFDRDHIAQVGFMNQFQTDLFYIPSYRVGAAQIYSGDKKGQYKSTIPENWKAALKWYYEGMWGDHPFMATGLLQAAPEFGNGNVFNAGKAAMALTPLWYTCCLSDFAKAGLQFQIGVMPVGDDGQIHGRVDADTFRIWKGTKHPKEAFEVVSYLITTGADKLLPTYGALPAISSKTQAFFDKKTADYPFVTADSWAAIKAGLAYPDNPSAEQYQPNWTEAWTRERTFGDLLRNTPPDQMNFDTEWTKMIDDVNVIYNK